MTAALLLPILAFLFGSLLVAAAVLARTPKTAETIERRLGEVTASVGRPVDDPAWEKTAVQLLKRLGSVAPKASDTGKLQKRLVSAGYRSTEALIVFSGVRVGFSLLMFALFVFTKFASAAN